LKAAAIVGVVAERRAVQLSLLRLLLVAGGLKFLADSVLLSLWLRKLLVRYGAEQLALALMQLSHDVNRARAFQGAVDFV
jgi:hypothetical protein